MKRTTLIVAIFLAGCNAHPGQRVDLAPIEHDCTVEQMAVVEKETLFCNNNTTYFSTYCYNTAIMRRCTKRPT